MTSSNLQQHDPITRLGAAIYSAKSEGRKEFYEKIAGTDPTTRRYWRALTRAFDAWRDVFSFEIEECDTEQLFKKLSTMKNEATGQLCFPGLNISDVQAWHLNLCHYDHERDDRVPHLKGRVLSQRVFHFPFAEPRLYVKLLRVDYRRHSSELEAEPRFRNLRKGGTDGGFMIPAIVTKEELVELDIGGLSEVPLKPLLTLERAFREAHGSRADGTMQALWLKADDFKDQRHYLIAAYPGTTMSVTDVSFSNSPLLPEPEIVAVDIEKLPL